MAIDQEILIAAKARDDKQLEISSFNPGYSDYSCDLQNIK